jgi:WD40 repeat protein
MSTHSILSESSSNAAHKRHAVAPQDEGPLLLLPSSSSSLAQQASSTSLHLIADLILPFVPDRATWNNLYSTSKELHAAGKKMTPPWPNKSFNVGSNVHVRHVAFSPSGSQLAFCVNNAYQHVVHVWDRWGMERLIGGHTEYIYCLEYSLDGEYLASGSADGSIRISNRESCDATSSPTRTPKEADKILLGSRSVFIVTLSFSRTDSNILASGGSNGDVKVWNIKERACVHSFDSGGGSIRSLFFAGGIDSACLAATHDMSIIRLWRPEGSSEFASETIGNTDVSRCIPRPVFSPSGSFLATSFSSRTGNGNESTIALYELDTMTKTQSVVMPGFIATHLAVSPDSKQLVVVGRKGRIRLLQTDDFSIQRDMDTTGEAKAVCSSAFDPTCRFLAVGYQDGRLELRSLQMSTQRSAIYL